MRIMVRTSLPPTRRRLLRLLSLLQSLLHLYLALSVQIVGDWRGWATRKCWDNSVGVVLAIVQWLVGRGDELVGGDSDGERRDDGDGRGDGNWGNCGDVDGARGLGGALWWAGSEVSSGNLHCLDGATGKHVSEVCSVSKRNNSQI